MQPDCNTRSLVIGRRVAPLSSVSKPGEQKNGYEHVRARQSRDYLRQAKGWQDPFALLAKEDPTQTRLASVISRPRAATFSGAVVVDAQGELVIEGVAGEGDRFMLGRDSPQDLPASVQADVPDAASRVAASASAYFLNGCTTVIAHGLFRCIEERRQPMRWSFLDKRKHGSIRYRSRLRQFARDSRDNGTERRTLY